MKTVNDIIAEVWPDWKLESVIGAGSYGEVYRAVREDAVGKSTAAIKVIKTHPLNIRALSRDKEDARNAFEQLMQRFSREIQLTQSLKGQTNLVSIDDYQVKEDPESGIWYFLIRMELLTPLLVDLDIHPYDEEKLIRMGIDLCRALEICESEQIVHRDIKPENIFVNHLGDFKLGDFGVARTLDVTRETMTAWNFDQWERFAAPEIKNGQAQEMSFDEARKADIYSLGMVLYWIANNRRFPFLQEKQLYNNQERNDAERRRLQGEPLPPPGSVSRELQDVILKACAFRSKDRYESAGAFRKALEEVRCPEEGKACSSTESQAPISENRSKRRWLLPAVLLCVLALAVVSWVLFRPKSETDSGKETVTPLVAGEVVADTLRLVGAQYPHVYNIGQPLSLGGRVISDADLTELVINLYANGEIYTQRIGFPAGTKSWSFAEAGDELFRKLGEGSFQLEVIASDAYGRKIGYSHTSTASLTAEDHVVYDINRACIEPELKGSMVYGGHTYEVYLFGSGWNIANAFAQGRGGHLVTFSGEDEFNVVTSFCLGMGCKYLNIGAQYVDGEWSWVDGTDFSFHPWSPYNPKDGEIPYNPVGGVIYTSAKQWFINKATPYEMSYFIMEYDDVLQ